VHSPAKLLEEDVHVKAPLSIQQSDLQTTKLRQPSAGNSNNKACLQKQAIVNLKISKYPSNTTHI
jgi:hypothetical protein